MYNASNAQEGPQGGPQGGQQSSQEQGHSSDDVTDVDFEEVK
jgi:molecular chaperone DnaK